MMDSSFHSAFDNLMALEGGKTTDHAGPTNFGITLRALMDTGDPDFDLDHDGDIDKKDLWAFTRDDAREYVYRYWWRPLNLNEVLSPMVASKILDIAYNCGVPRGVKILQKTLNRFGHHLKVDGVIGSKTLGAINGTPDTALVDGLRAEQRRWYEYLVRSNPGKYGPYARGWYRRANT